MAEKNLCIVIDDGREKVPIKNKHGDEVGVFYFNPTDLGIISRYNDMADRFDYIFEPLDKMGDSGIAADGTAEDPSDTATVEALQEAEKRLYEACDKLFGGNLSEAFFGKIHPFSPIKGQFYCEMVLDVVGAFISEQFDQEIKRIKAREARVAKYTHGYEARTGRHKDGKK